MKIISAGSLADGRFEGASDGPSSISMILDESGGPGRARVICIHASPTIIGEFLE